MRVMQLCTLSEVTAERSRQWLDKNAAAVQYLLPFRKDDSVMHHFGKPQERGHSGQLLYIMTLLHCRLACSKLLGLIARY